MLLLTFSVVLLMSFATVMASTRATREMNVLQQRLMDLRKLRPAAVNEEEDLRLEKEGKSTWFTQYMECFAQNKALLSLRVLLGQSATSLTLGSFALRSIALGYLLSLAVYMTLGEPVLEVLAFFAGCLTPWFWLRMKRKRRIAKFEQQLPEAMELMTRALRAGHSVQAALEIVAEQSREPLHSEFSQVHQEQVFGVVFRDALRQCGERVPSNDLRFLITAMVVQKETGGDLIEILDRTTQVIRERGRVQAEVQTYTAQGRLTGWILSALPVVLLIIASILTPSYAKVLFTDPTGHLLLGAAAVLIFLGAITIRRVARVEV